MRVIFQTCSRLCGTVINIVIVRNFICVSVNLELCHIVRRKLALIEIALVNKPIIDKTFDQIIIRTAFVKCAKRSCPVLIFRVIPV